MLQMNCLCIANPLTFKAISEHWYNNSIVQMPTLCVPQLIYENLGSIGHQSREKITGKPTLVSFRHVMSCV